MYGGPGTWGGLATKGWPMCNGWQLGSFCGDLFRCLVYHAREDLGLEQRQETIQSGECYTPPRQNLLHRLSRPWRYGRFDAACLHKWKGRMRLALHWMQTITTKGRGRQGLFDGVHLHIFFVVLFLFCFPIKLHSTGEREQGSADKPRPVESRLASEMAVQTSTLGHRTCTAVLSPL